MRGEKKPIAAAVKAIQADAAFKTRLSELGVSALSLSPEEFGTYLGAETEKWAEVVKFADLKPQ